jgi:hypothetical protein
MNFQVSSKTTTIKLQLAYASSVHILHHKAISIVQAFSSGQDLSIVYTLEHTVVKETY